ncbi:MAG TPA: TIGR02611 family protein [Actinomycetes bacterium]
MARSDGDPLDLAVDDRQQPAQGPWYLRLRDRARDCRATDLAWRAVVFGLGWTVVAAGLLMLVLPGPGWAVVFLGLAILGSEFAWARQLLRRSREWVRRAARQARNPARRRRNLLLCCSGLLTLALAATWYLATYGLTLDGPHAWFGL